MIRLHDVICNVHVTMHCQWEGKPQDCPFPLGDLHRHLRHGSVAPLSFHPKRHVDRLSRFGTGSNTNRTQAAERAEKCHFYPR